LLDEARFIFMGSRLGLRRLSCVAATVAISLMAAAIAAAALVRTHNPPIASPAPTGPSLFMFQQPAPMIDFYTWDGKLVRRLMTSLPVVPTDDGRLYADSSGRIYETQGRQIGLVADWHRLSNPLWADDGAHICGTTTGKNGTRVLDVVGIHGDSRRYILDRASNYAVVSACSFRSGRAAILDNGVLRIVSLRDGSTMNTIEPSAHSEVELVSRDARWIARKITPETGNWLIEVVDVTDGSTKASYDSVYPAAFSADDRLLVVGVGSTETRVIDWRTGTVVWSRATYGTYSGLSGVVAVSDVATDKLLLAQSTDNPNAFHAREFWIVDRQGSARPFYPVP
jgi:hypothetical protein